jgi:hypothetical protein
LVAADIMGLVGIGNPNPLCTFRMAKAGIQFIVKSAQNEDEEEWAADELEELEQTGLLQRLACSAVDGGVVRCCRAFRWSRFGSRYDERVLLIAEHPHSTSRGVSFNQSLTL